MHLLFSCLKLCYMNILFIISCSNSLKNSYHFISIKVLCVGNLYNPDVRYSFNIPIEDRSDLYTWDPYGPWQDCSRMCQGTVNYFVSRTKDLMAFRKGLVLSTWVFRLYLQGRNSMLSVNFRCSKPLRAGMVSAFVLLFSAFM